MYYDDKLMFCMCIKPYYFVLRAATIVRVP